ncbi:MAG: guanylyl cyclase, partial [Gemmatimonadetes bacterium]|nr:guanylyl cyclase [Gemmatimonadota bacterium]NIR77633.1 guanylyl cyclase [Gemmatimonadota bacterium]NIT86174.1 guanylyl cyclase [Gemmatimonadota bacterium]NIU29998.1 guanylyl cyclase [Gemmatimonadota bacterium]NIU34964.1 guanylyl cyclase [Gemmatimonadota bacterium]
AILGGVAAFALWGVVAAGWVLFASGPEDEEAGGLVGGAGDRPTLAVLPFTNMSPDEENAYFADGVHEDILTHLSKIRDLTVLARTSMIRYRDSDKSVEEIAAELDADAVLEGSVRRAGDQIRVVAQLIDPGTA